MLTKKQKEILDFINHFIKEKDYSPSYEEIAKHFKLKSVATVHEHVENLKNKGYLNKPKKQPRGLEVKTVKIPFLGTIAAGSPIDVVENKEEIEVEKSIVSSPKDHYALKVQGDSMIEEGISDGDTVIIRKQPTAENGEKVVALINGNEATLKKIYREKNGFRLQPANPKLKPIFTDNLIIQGKVITIIKNFEELKKVSLTKIKDKKENKQNPNDILKKWLNTVQCIDCVEGMKKLPNNCIDLIFADPPYNLSKSNFKIKFTKTGGTDLSTNKGSWDNFNHQDYETFTEQWLKESFRILKENGSIWVAGTYHNVYLVGYLMQKIGFEILNEILWHKSDATPNMSCTRFVADHENFIWARKGKKHLFNYDQLKQLNGNKQMRSTWTKGKTTGGKKIHPTQKPEWLLERVILATSVPTNIILDPFLGSGTTAVAAKKLNRNFIGLEIDKSYVKKSLERIKGVNLCLPNI